MSMSLSGGEFSEERSQFIKDKDIICEGNKMTKLKNILESEISQQVENFILDGYKKITLEKQSDGTWTIKAE